MSFALKVSKSRSGPLVIWATWETASGVLCKKRIPDNEMVRLWFEQVEDDSRDEQVGSDRASQLRERHPSVIQQFRAK